VSPCTPKNLAVFGGRISHIIHKKAQIDWSVTGKDVKTEATPSRINVTLDRIPKMLLPISDQNRNVASCMQLWDLNATQKLWVTSHEKNLAMSIKMSSEHPADITDLYRIYLKSFAVAFKGHRPQQLDLEAIIHICHTWVFI